jgi:urease accessory protein
VTARLPAEGAAARIWSRSRLVFDAARGRTRLAVCDVGSPLRVMRGFELSDGRLLVQIISAAPGLFAGDRYELTVEARAGARAVILTPAATKIHSMPGGGCAQQQFRVEVADAASVEIYPTLSIPFPDSDFEQTAHVSLEGESRFGWLEPWSFGRIGSGEKYVFRRISTRLSVDRDGAPAYRDALEVAPADGAPGGWGLLESATHSAAGCWLGPSDAWTPEGALDADIVFGQADDETLYARGLFLDGSAFQQGLAAIRRKAAHIWGMTEIPFDKFTL